MTGFNWKNFGAKTAVFDKKIFGGQNGCFRMENFGAKMSGSK